MKRFVIFVFLLSLAAAGYYSTLSPNDPQRRQITLFANRASRQVQKQVETGLAQAGTRLNKEIEPAAPQLTKWEKLLCDLANAERRKRGMRAMKIDSGLALVARGHSAEMMKKKYFSHTSPTPTRATVQDRYRLHFKATPRLIAENIYTLQVRGPRRLTEADIRRAHEGWMKSPGHRANILRTTPLSPERIGVGITVHGGSFWATQNFSTPM